MMAAPHLLHYVLIILSLSLASLSASAGDIYKHKDKNGRWVFSDKKSSSAKKLTPTVQLQKDKKTPRIKLTFIDYPDHYELQASNPFYAPVELTLIPDDKNHETQTHIVPAKKTVTLISSATKLPHYSVRTTMGDPAAKADEYMYRIPVSSGLEHQITQAFNGQFSHTTPSNQYAVDIAMQVGTDIVAARDGIVVDTRDGYYLSGRSHYFVDKANAVVVMHSDGTFALYAHLLQSSLVVKPGDTVTQGQKLARSGSSGYSTGPHLHFVIQKNSGSTTVSVPFVFNHNNHVFTPTEGMHFKAIR